MALLKEDGSLDIERINNLPLEEHLREVAQFSNEERKEYISKLSINESKTTIPMIYTSLRQEINSGNLIDAWEVINKL